MAAPAEVNQFIPLCVPEIRGREWELVKSCLDTGWVSSVGEYVDDFERHLGRAAGVPYAVATSCGTAALHTALLVAGVQREDEVLVSGLTFIAPANAIRYAGAWPVFIDADPLYWQMDPQRATDFLERGCQWSRGELRNRATGRRVRAILPVHILGHPVDMKPLLDAADKFGLVVIEDATESLGAAYDGRPVGGIGTIGCFSFNGNKLITTGGGGMLVTREETMALRARYLTTQAKDDPIEYVHQSVGYNYRLTNLQAAMGIAQIEQLQVFLSAKHAIADRYSAGLGSVPGITLPSEARNCRSAWWMYTVLIDPGRFGQTSRQLLRRLADSGIQTRPLWQPLHRSAAHKGAFACGGEVADRLHETALSLPCSVGLNGEQQDRVISCIRNLHLRSSA